MKLVDNTNPENHWHLTFVQMNVDENVAHTLLSLSNTEEQVKRTFGIVKAQFQSIDKTDCVIDLRDSNYDIIDNCVVTYKQMKNLTDLLGFELNEPTPPELYQLK